MSEVRGSRILWTILLSFAPCLLSTCLHAQYGGGTGEPNDPYLIYTPAQMNAIGADPNDWDKHFKLMADLELGEYAGEQFNVIGRPFEHYEPPQSTPYLILVPFQGVFDGNDHAIVNFTWSSPGRNYVGIFGYVDGPTAEIRNLRIVDPNVATEGGASVGSLVGCLSGGALTNCSVRGGKTAGTSDVGGLVGAVSVPHPSGRIKIASSPTPGGVVSDCHTDTRVTGNEYVGGLVGRNEGTITDCNSTGIVSGKEGVGGMVGYSRVGKLENCLSRSDVTGQTNVGGLAGNLGFDAEIARCQASGTVAGETYIGGLVGQSASSTITRCQASGTVTGVGTVGGLVGDSYGTLEDCCASGAVTGVEAAGGLAGRSGGTITRCRATGAVSGDDQESRDLGGLVGATVANITASYATGTVRGAERAGGLVGFQGYGRITNCYARGMVWGTQYLGGFAGSNGGTIVNCYATGLVVGGQSMGGLVALSGTYGKVDIVGSFWDVQATRQATSAGGAGKSTLKMRSAATFLNAGWDFVEETANGTEDIWWIEEGKDYPRLTWELESESVDSDTP